MSKKEKYQRPESFVVELEAGMAIMVGSETEIYGPGGVPNEDETPNPDGEGQLDEE